MIEGVHHKKGGADSFCKKKLSAIMKKILSNCDQQHHYLMV